MTLQTQILAACPTWTTSAQIAAHVGRPRQEVRAILRVLLAAGRLERQSHSPIASVKPGWVVRRTE